VSESHFLDLNSPEHAYLFGFLQADGHLHRGKGNKGSLSVEVMASDRLILESFARLIPFHSGIYERRRTTYFKEAHASVAWYVSNQSFREELVRLGLPEGRKSAAIAPPIELRSSPDYYRGLIDADGSLGLTSPGFPFVSLTTASDLSAECYIDYLFRITGQLKSIRRNRRDNVFNIVVYKEDAQAVASRLYYDGCLALPRKSTKARDVGSWRRPDSMTRVSGRKSWTCDQDRIVLLEPTKIAASMLGRTVNSITVRRARLRLAGRSVTA